MKRTGRLILSILVLFAGITILIKAPTLALDYSSAHYRFDIIETSPYQNDETDNGEYIPYVEYVKMVCNSIITIGFSVFLL